FPHCVIYPRSVYSSRKRYIVSCVTVVAPAKRKPEPSLWQIQKPATRLARHQATREQVVVHLGRDLGVTGRAGALGRHRGHAVRAPGPNLSVVVATQLAG